MYVTQKHPLDKLWNINICDWSVCYKLRHPNYLHISKQQNVFDKINKFNN